MMAFLLRTFFAGGAVLALAAGVGAPAGAQGLVSTHRIPAALANEAVMAAVEACKSKGFAETAVLVDASGARQALLRGDGAGIHTLDSAYGKAYTSASFKANSGAVRERIMANPQAAGLAALPNILMVGGGVVIKLGDEVIGGIGAAGAPGADIDEACAQAGLDKIKDRLK